MSHTLDGRIRNAQDSLNQLIQRLEDTDPYFVRCIKPNGVQAPTVFDSELVLAQLRYTGMVETIRIRALGYSLRMSFDDFYARYFPCKPAENRETPLADKCRDILDHAQLVPPACQLGRTKVCRPAERLWRACLPALTRRRATRRRIRGPRASPAPPGLSENQGPTSARGPADSGPGPGRDSLDGVRQVHGDAATLSAHARGGHGPAALYVTCLRT